MTAISDIVKHVRETDGWEIKTQGLLRRSGLQRRGPRPIESMAAISLDDISPDEIHVTADRLEISEHDLQAIVWAADDWPGHARNLRRRLLRAARAKPK